MTTETIENHQITFIPAMWRTDTKSQQEESFNNYWAEYCRRKALGFKITALPLSPETAFKQPQNTLLSEEDIVKTLQPAIIEPQISRKNLEAIKFLDQWMAEPDDLGEEFWKEFCDDLEKNRFTI